MFLVDWGVNAGIFRWDKTAEFSSIVGKLAMMFETELYTIDTCKNIVESSILLGKHKNIPSQAAPEGLKSKWCSFKTSWNYRDILSNYAEKIALVPRHWFLNGKRVFSLFSLFPLLISICLQCINDARVEVFWAFQLQIVIVISWKTKLKQTSRFKLLISYSN